MNKLPTLIGAFILLSLPAFPQTLNLSTGYGVMLGANFDTLTAKLNNGLLQARQSYNQFNYGAIVFFDMGYVMADLTFSGSFSAFIHNEELKNYTYVDADYALGGMNMGLGVYGKYPFEMDQVLIFPILGAQFGIGVAQNFIKDFEARNAKKGNSYGMASDWTALSIKAGVGFDLDLNLNTFIRGGFLLYYKLNSLLDQAFVDAIANSSNDASAVNVNLGFDLEFLIGYRIGSASILPASRNTGGSNASGIPGGGDDEIFYPRGE
jgi:hypothetical protein